MRPEHEYRHLADSTRRRGYVEQSALAMGNFGLGNFGRHLPSGCRSRCSSRIVETNLGGCDKRNADFVAGLCLKKGPGHEEPGPNSRDASRLWGALGAAQPSN